MKNMQSNETRTVEYSMEIPISKIWRDYGNGGVLFKNIRRRRIIIIITIDDYKENSQWQKKSMLSNHTSAIRGWPREETNNWV